MEDQGKKGNVDVQSLVERPQVYILARCGSSEAEQIACISTRKACLEGLKNKLVTSNGVQIADVMRLFHGDGPKREFESGEQKGGMLAVQAAVVMLKSTRSYEVLPTEPLHDVKDHICNVLTELPVHLEEEESHHFQSIIECTFAGKEKLRGCDYRLAAVVVAQYLR
ncbi:hypothetical protein AWC38_SpisGene17480, partial [Stylophora pistillata]